MLILVLAGLPLCTGCVGAIYPKKKVAVEQKVPSRESTPEKPSAPGQAAPQAGEQELLRQAEQAQYQARYPESLEKYRSFLNNYPRSSQADTALVAMGQIYERLGQNDQAALAYQKLLDEHPSSSFAGEARKRVTALYLNSGQYEMAVKSLGNMLERSQRPEEKARLRILMGRAQMGLKNRIQAMDLLIRAARETDDPVDRDEAQRLIKANIKDMSLEELSQARTLYGNQYPGGLVAYVMAYRYFEGQETEKAREAIDYFLSNFSSDELYLDGQALKASIESGSPPPVLSLPTLAEIPETAPGPAVPVTETPLIPAGPSTAAYRSRDLACLMPLTGTPAAKYGQQVLQGLRLAFANFQAQTDGFRANLVVHDTQGDSEKAKELLRQIAGQESVIGVIGPLTSKVSGELAPLAEELKMPMLAISQKEGLGGQGSHVFRLFLTPQAQAQAVARYAVQVLGMNKLAILHPEDAYGNKMRDYFWDETARLGGEVVGVQGYNPKDTDFSAQIQSLAGVGAAQRQVKAGRKVNVHFDAVFIPDSYRAVAMIAPQFAYHDITTVRLLGTSLWHTPRLIEAAARYTQRCVIPTAFFSGSERPEVQRFLELYRTETGQEDAEPDQFVAYGYDAAMLMLTLMDRDHASEREQVVQALHSMPPYPGVTARFNFGDDGEYKSEPTLLTIEGEEFKMIQ